MPAEQNKPLDITALTETYKAQALPRHEKWGVGLRYRFGSSCADVYPAPIAIAPAVRIRTETTALSLGDVLHVAPTETGGLHVDHANGSCEVSRRGDLAYVYTAPSVVTLSDKGQTRTDVYGRSYTQTSMEVEGSPEGKRVTIYGVIEAAPKPVNGRRNSTLQFNLLEYNPDKPDEPIQHEVWARNQAREALKKLKLKQGDSVEAVMYRHTWQVALQGGKTETHTRHNLTAITRVERKGDAKRQKTDTEM